MEEYPNAVPQYPLRAPAPVTGTPQINEQVMSSSWQPQAHLHNHGQHQSQHNHQPQPQHHGANGFDLSPLNLQKQSLPHRPSISLSHDQVDHMKHEASRLIADERRQLDEAEQVLAMPGFLKAFDLFLRAS